MKFAFLLPAYHIYNDRCRVLTNMLTSAGHKVAIFINNKDIKDGDVPISYLPWHEYHFDKLDKFSPDLVIIWNGYFPYLYSSTIYLRRKYRLAIIELGWLPQISHSYIAPDLAQASPIAQVPYVGKISQSTKNQDLLEKARSIYNNDLPSNVKLPRRFSFIPMQMEYDTQILFTSHTFKTMNSFIHYIYKTVGDIPIIVRNHPREVDIKRPDVVKDYTKISPSFPLMTRATAVIGINSTVLAEAVLFQKAVYIFGRHVCERVSHFWPIETYPQWESGHVENSIEYKDVCDYRSLVLLSNQWDNSNPGGWAIDMLVSMANGEYQPRVPT